MPLSLLYKKSQIRLFVRIWLSLYDLTGILVFLGIPNSVGGVVAVYSSFMVEHRGVSSRASTALGQASSEATLWPHSLLAQVLLPYAFMA